MSYKFNLPELERPSNGSACEFQSCIRNAICVCDKCGRNICFIHLDVDSRYFECICQTCMRKLKAEEKARNSK
jgi:hypothetical protein